MGLSPVSPYITGDTPSYGQRNVGKTTINTWFIPPTRMVMGDVTTVDNKSMFESKKKHLTCGYQKDVNPLSIVGEPTNVQDFAISLHLPSSQLHRSAGGPRSLRCIESTGSSWHPPAAQRRRGHSAPAGQRSAAWERRRAPEPGAVAALPLDQMKMASDVIYIYIYVYIYIYNL